MKVINFINNNIIKEALKSIELQKVQNFKMKKKIAEKRIKELDE